MIAATQRLFFALWPDEAVRANIATMLSQITPPADGRTVAAVNLHLTLLFIGPADTTMRYCMEDAAAEFRGPRFSLPLTRIGHWRQPRVVWLAPACAPPELLSLVQKLEDAAARCGLTTETRPYFPHITLARKVQRYGPEFAVRPLLWGVHNFSLVESRTTINGIRYQVLNSWHLADE